MRELRLAGASVSAIAAATGAARTTVLRHTGDLPAPQTVLGVDGRSYRISGGASRNGHGH